MGETSLLHSFALLLIIFLQLTVIVQAQEYFLPTNFTLKTLVGKEYDTPAIYRHISPIEIDISGDEQTIYYTDLSSSYQNHFYSLDVQSRVVTPLLDMMVGCFHVHKQSGDVYYLAGGQIWAMRKLTKQVELMAGAYKYPLNLDENVNALDASLNTVNSLFVDEIGNIYYSELNRIRIITKTTGNVTTLFGNYTDMGFSPDGLTNGGMTKLSYPNYVKVSDGFLYFYDSGNKRIRKFSLSTKIMTTVSGNGQQCTTENLNEKQSPTQQAICGNYAISPQSGNIVINGPLIQITPQGKISFLSGNQTYPFISYQTPNSDEGAPAIKVKLDTINGLAFGMNSDNLYFSEGLSRVAKIDSEGNIRTILGSKSNFIDGINSDYIHQSEIKSAFIDKYGDVWYTQFWIRRIHKSNQTVSTTSIICEKMLYLETTHEMYCYNSNQVFLISLETFTTKLILGSGVSPVSQIPDGLNATNMPIYVQQMFTTPSGKFYWLDAGFKMSIKTIESDGKVKTLMGGGSDKTGTNLKPNETEIEYGSAFVVSTDGIIYVADHYGLLKKLAPNGLVEVIGGRGYSERDNIRVIDRTIFAPDGILYDKNGNLVISTYTDLLKVDKNSWNVTSIAHYTFDFVFDGTVDRRSSFNGPTLFYITPQGEYLVGDKSSSFSPPSRLRRLTPSCQDGRISNNNSCLKCLDGFTYNNMSTACMTACYDISSDSPLACSANGRCNGPNACSCKNQWYSRDCSVTSCFGIYSNTTSVCNGKGICGQPDSCSCIDSLFVGPECNLPFITSFNIEFNRSSIRPNEAVSLSLSVNTLNKEFYKNRNIIYKINLNGTILDIKVVGLTLERYEIENIDLTSQQINQLNASVILIDFASGSNISNKKEASMSILPFNGNDSTILLLLLLLIIPILIVIVLVVIIVSVACVKWKKKTNGRNPTNSSELELQNKRSIQI